MPMRKAQSAMEYLMTYGWAILIVIIVAAALYMLGVFDPATYTQSTAVGFQGFQVPSGGWQFTSSGTMTVILRNTQGHNIEITSLNVTYQSQTHANITGIVMTPNDEKRIVVSGFTGLSQGSPYSAQVDITFDNIDTGITDFKTKGTLSGSVS